MVEGTSPEGRRQEWTAMARHGMATAAKAYGELRSRMKGLHEPKASVKQLPLWNMAILQRETGATY